MDSDCDVAVVGAGLGGLLAARDLAGAGKSVVVLEARDRVGGRTLNADLGPGKVVEVGGQWLGPGQDAAYQLAADLGLATFPTHDEGENLLEWRGSVTSYTGTIPRLNPAVLADIAQAQLRSDRMARKVPLARPWAARRAGRWDSQTFATWIRRNTATRAAAELLEIGVEAVWAAEPGELSLLHALFYIHSGGGWSSLLDTAGGAQQDRIVGGSQLLSLRVAEGLGGALRMASPVRRISQDSSGVTVAADGQDTLRAEHAVVALPPALACRIDYEPALPAARDQLAQRMPMGTVTKCHAVYEEPFWRSEGRSGQATSDRGPARVVFDNSPPDGEPGVLLAFLEGRHARRLARATAGERRAAVLDGLARLFGERASRPERYMEQAWADEPWSRGGYGAALTPGAWTDFGHALREPVGRIHWAGTETAEVWNGYMDGAIRSGRAAARAILGR